MANTKIIIKPGKKYYNFQYNSDSKPIKYCKVYVYNDKTIVNGKLLRVNHIYYAPKGHEQNMEYFIEPLKEPDYNIKADAHAYNATTSKEKVHHHPFLNKVATLFGII